MALFPVRRGLVSRSSLLGFDFEGGQVAYAEAGCGPDSVYLESAAAPSPVAPGATGCPARILTRRTRLPPGRILPVRFRCPRGRSMTYTLRVLRGNRAYIDPDIPLTVERGTRTVRIKLPRSVLRFLRGLRVARIELDAEVRSDRVSFRHRNVEAALRVRLR